MVKCVAWCYVKRTFLNLLFVCVWMHSVHHSGLHVFHLKFFVCFLFMQFGVSNFNESVVVHPVFPYISVFASFYNHYVFQIWFQWNCYPPNSVHECRKWYDQNFISEYYLIKFILLILSITPHLKSLIDATMECEICVQVYILCNHTCLHLLQKKTYSKDIPNKFHGLHQVMKRFSLH